MSALLELQNWLPTYQALYEDYHYEELIAIVEPIRAFFRETIETVTNVLTERLGARPDIARLVGTYDTDDPTYRVRTAMDVTALQAAGLTLEEYRFLPNPPPPIDSLKAANEEVAFAATSKDLSDVRSVHYIMDRLTHHTFPEHLLIAICRRAPAEAEAEES